MLINVDKQTGFEVPEGVKSFLAALGRKEPVFKINPKTSALLVIDMQRDFLCEGAPLEGHNCRDIVPNVKKLIEHSRKNKIPVIWAIHVHSPHGGDMGLMEEMWPKTGPKGGGLVKGKAGARIYDSLPQPLDSEIVIEKHRYSAFFQTDLELHLRRLGVDTLIITGMHTNICCQTTARDGFMRDFKIVFVSDGVASFTPELHKAGLIDIAVAFGRVMNSVEVIQELSKK